MPFRSIASRTVRLLEVARRIGERDVRERLRKVSDETAPIRVVLLAEQTDVVFQIE